ncbi:hypothetical protein [Streptomyces sp. NPDC008137]
MISVPLVEHTRLVRGAYAALLSRGRVRTSPSGASRGRGCRSAGYW